MPRHYRAPYAKPKPPQVLCISPPYYAAVTVTVIVVIRRYNEVRSQPHFDESLIASPLTGACEIATLAIPVADVAGTEIIWSIISVREQQLPLFAGV